MNVVAYCRVSTNKEEQLDSLEAQQQFFSTYAQRNGYDLIGIYADEGKSGTKMKNRTQLLKMLSDAHTGRFEAVLIKDVSRLARNTVDFLTSIRKLKAIGVKIDFVNYDLTTAESSEFMLTMLSAIAQEESANTSKRVKFGKKINAEKGRVPNLCFGYDKIPGEYFNLNINEKEAETVRDIFDMYANRNMGANKIAQELNRRSIKTKRGSKWQQPTVCRVLCNEIYIGKIINGKAEVEDFLTGKRKERDKSDWMVADRPDLRIIDDVTFLQAQRLMQQRQDSFKKTGERNSQKNLYSKLIRCRCCGLTFRRLASGERAARPKWVCSGRNTMGTDYCQNKTVIDESALTEDIRSYFRKFFSDRPGAINSVVSEFEKRYRAKNENITTERDISAQLQKLRRTKDKYIEMFNAEVITLAELKDKTQELNVGIARLDEELRYAKENISKSDRLSMLLEGTFKNIESVLDAQELDNSMVSRIINRIEVSEAGELDIFLKMFSDVGIDKNILLNSDRT